MFKTHVRRGVAAILLLGSVALGAREAQATTILPDCATCGDHKTAWDLTLSLIDDANNIYRLTATATYGSPIDFNFVNAIAFKIDAFVNNYDASPSVTGPAEGGTWTVIGGGINADGCSGSGNGFFCANSTGFGAAHGVGGTDTWTFLLDVNNNLPNVVTSPGSFKAMFTDGDANKEGPLLSEGVTYGPPADVSTPEPATLVLFGTGLAAIATAIRRRRKS